MTYKPQYDIVHPDGTVIISYLDPISYKITSITYDNVNAKLIADINRLMRSNNK